MWPLSSIVSRTRMPKKFAPGDIFGVPLPNGLLALGQVLSRERQALNSVGCALFSETLSEGAPVPEFLSPVSVMLVTPDLLSKGVWPVLSNREPVVAASNRPYEQLRDVGWIGAKVTGSGIVQEFVAAYHCLVPWDDWYLPDYLDRLLLPGVSRPHGVLLCKGG
jgi:hypothetical protein